MGSPGIKLRGSDPSPLSHTHAHTQTEYYKEKELKVVAKVSRSKVEGQMADLVRIRLYVVY